MNKMPDPFGSFGGMMGKFRSFLQNPMQLITQRIPNMPQGIQGDPDAMIQFMLDNGYANQEMYNMANKIGQQVQQNPQFKNFMGGPNQPKR